MDDTEIMTHEQFEAAKSLLADIPNTPGAGTAAEAFAYRTIAEPAIATIKLLVPALRHALGCRGFEHDDEKYRIACPECADACEILEKIDGRE